MKNKQTKSYGDDLQLRLVPKGTEPPLGIDPIRESDDSLLSSSRMTTPKNKLASVLSKMQAVDEQAEYSRNEKIGSPDYSKSDRDNQNVLISSYDHSPSKRLVTKKSKGSSIRSSVKNIPTPA